MEKKEYFRQALEAQVLHLMEGTKGSTKDLDERSKKLLFEDSFQKGYFRKSDGSLEPYKNMDEMVQDLVAEDGTPKVGKRVIAMPAVYSTRPDASEAIAFSFSDDAEELYTNLYAPEAKAPKDNVDLSSLNRAKQTYFDQKEFVPELGEEPEKPGGLLSELWNRIVKFFTGHSSDAWKEYDAYQAKKAGVQKIKNDIAAYDSEDKKAFGKELLNAINEARVNAMVPEAAQKKDEPVKTEEMLKEEREARLNNGTATKDDLRAILDEETALRNQMNAEKKPSDPGYLEPMMDVELLLNHYDVADGVNTHGTSSVNPNADGAQILSEDMLLDEGELTEAQECARLAFAIKVSRVQRAAAANGERIPLQGFAYHSEESDLDFAETQYRLKKDAVMAGLTVEDTELGEFSPKEQLAMEAKQEFEERADVFMREVEAERPEEEIKAEYEEMKQQAREEADAKSTYTDIGGAQIHGNALNESRLPDEDVEFDLESVSAEEELEKVFGEDEAQPENAPAEKKEEPKAEVPEEPKAEAPEKKEEEVPDELNDSLADQVDFREERETAFKEAENGTMALTNFNRMKKDIAALKAEGGVLESLAKQADVALGDMLEAYSGDRVYSHRELVSDMGSLILVQQLTSNETLKNSFVNSEPREGYLNADHKKHLDLIEDGSDFQFAVEKVLKSQNTPDFKNQMKAIMLSDTNEKTMASPLNAIYEECLVEKNKAMLMGSKAEAKAERAKEREERAVQMDSKLMK